MKTNINPAHVAFETLYGHLQNMEWLMNRKLYLDLKSCFVMGFEAGVRYAERDAQTDTAEGPARTDQG